MNSFFRKLGWLTRRRSKEEQLTAELRFHLEEEAEERRTAGMSAEDARWAARRDFGNVTLVREDTRGAWSWITLEQLAQDVRQSARMMLQKPAFPVLAALSLALGIGANTAIYSFMEALLMRSLPVADPKSLVVLNWRVTGKKSVSDSVVHNVSGAIYDDPKGGQSAAIFPFPAFEALRKSTDVFSALFAYRPARKLNLMAQGHANLTSGEFVSGEYFRGLGLVPAAGRVVGAADDQAGATGVVMLSYGFAQGRFGGVAAAVGQPVTINNIPFTVIGVAPAGFDGVDPSKAADFYLPMHASLLLDAGKGVDNDPSRRYSDEHYYWTGMMGRLKPGVTMPQAQARLATEFAAWVAATATNQLEKENLPEFILRKGESGLDNLRRTYSRPLYLLLTMTGLILAIACANIANLLLARATARRREIAVRVSMGAGRWRLIRQLLTESLCLALLGGGAGVVFAIWGIQFLTNVMAAGNETFAPRPELNLNVMCAALLLTALTGLLFGLAPALQATRVDSMPAMKEARVGDDASTSRLGLSLGRMLVIAQMAICLWLLVGAGLFVRTLRNLESLQVGFERRNVLLFKLNARQAGHRDPEILSFYNDMERRLAAIPGVLSVAQADSPLIGEAAWGWPVVPAGKPRPEKAPTGHGSGFDRMATHVLGTGPKFFSTMRIPLLAGREFDDRDRAGATPVAIVNEAWAKVNLAGVNPIGQRVTSYGLSLKPQELEIVGLAGNAKYDDLTGHFPAVVYMPFGQNRDVPVDEMTFFLRTAGSPLAYANAVRKVVHEADARIPVDGLSTQAAQIEREMSPQIMFARLCTMFATLALTIACVGLYGTTSYAVARRTNEIGIRMALGAPRQVVVWMVLRDVLMLAAVGLVLSLPTAFGGSKLLQSLLYEVKPGDPQTMAAAVAILLGAVLMAGYWPARRASHIDPMVAVRHE